MAPVKAPKNPEVRYRKQLNLLVRSLRADINRDVLPLLKSFEPEYVNDAYASLLEETFDRLRTTYSAIGRQEKIVAASFVNNTNATNKQRFYKAIENGIGVDIRGIIQNEGLDDILVATTRENVGLIRSIPEEFFKKIENVVFTGTTQGRRATSMIKEIQEIGKVTTKRAKLIARDQTSKLNSALNQQRQQNLGIEEYIWKTSSDGRVRESHARNNNKTFRWDTPPKETGHPGQDIQCRCVAQPIIKI